MSTPAIYEFQGQDSQPEASLYIHHDGYPAGAAQYYLAACLRSDRGMFERFIRANERSELVHNGRSHGGSQYRYTLCGENTFAAHQRVSGSNVWKTIYVGNLVDFILQETGVRLIKFRDQYLDKDAAKEAIMGHVMAASNAIEQGWIGNAGSYATDAWNLLTVYMANHGPDNSSSAAQEAIASIDRELSKQWAGEYGDQAYAKWRETFRKVPA